MASSRVFSGCRVLLAAAKTKTPKSTTTTTTAKAAATTAKPVATTAAATEKKLSGISKPLPVSSALQLFVGAPEISRAQAIKKIWEYIKLHDLQNPANKRQVRCDEKLKTIFVGKEEIGMFDMAKLLSCHFGKATAA